MKDNAMSEKQFLESFLEYAEQLGVLEFTDYEDMKEFITRWLEYFHKTYYEVEFVKKGNPEIDYCYEELERAIMSEVENMEDDYPEVEGIEIESNYAKEQRYK